MAGKLDIDALYESQLHEWELARENYEGLRHTKMKTIIFDDHKIQVQFNPKRIVSSAARTDAQSISERPCFLCSGNRPKEQKGILYRKDYIVLLNPYPIADVHLTIPSLKHLPQRISGNFTTLLLIAKDLPDFTIIYNGPNCGASAPDHFHFQAIPANMLPIGSEFHKPISVRKWGAIKDTTLYTWHNYRRNLITISGKDPERIEEIFSRLYQLLSVSLPSKDEPMMNILARFEQGGWILHIFPRKQHRPQQYFETGDRQLLISPASIDMGGILIMPREQDFNKITADEIEDIYNQVCVDEFFINDIVTQLIEL